MLNTIKTALATLFLGFSALIAVAQPAANPDESLNGTPIPPFSLTTPDGVHLTPDLVPKNQPLIVFYFDPDCDHCSQQATWIHEKMGSFSGISLLWVSWGELPDIAGFREKHFPGVKKSDMAFAKDTEFKFDKWFGYSEVPTIIVYNKLGKRVKTFRHETPVDQLLSATKL